MSELAVTERGAAARSAGAAGFDARCRGESLYANPYADTIERAQEEGRRAGWTWLLWHAWNDGWRRADAMCDPAPEPGRRGRRKTAA